MSETDFRRRLEQVGRELDQATGRWTARRRRRRQALAAACSVLLVGGVAATVANELGSNGVEPAAARVLERAAEAEPGRARPRRGQYVYTETVVSTRTAQGTTRQRTELWAGANGSGVQVAHPSEFEPPPPAPTLTGPESAPSAPMPAAGDRARTRVDRYRKGAIGTGERASFDTSFRDRLLDRFGLGADQLERLASSQRAFDERVRAGAERVARQLEQSGAAPGQEAIDTQTFFLVANLLGQWGEPMPAGVRSALFRLAATLDGIDVNDGFTDDRGRRGIALSLGDARIVLAPDSFRLRSTTYQLGNSETSIETVRTAVVDRRRERPRSSPPGG